LAEVLEAHGGIHRWRTFSTLTAKVVTGGFLWSVKGFPLGDTARAGLLRRHDYEVEVASGARAAHLISDYVDVKGPLFPTQRRVFMRNEDGTLQLDNELYRHHRPIASPSGAWFNRRQRKN
jgi:hypothetical protein